MNWKTCPLQAVISGYEFNKFAATNDGQNHTQRHRCMKKILFMRA